MILKQCGGGLHYFDTTNKDFDKDQTTYYTFFNTVEREKTMLSQTRNQWSGRIKNNTETCWMVVYIDSKRSCPKESNKELSNYYRIHQQIRSHLCPPNTYHTSQGKHKKTRSPQDHPKDPFPPLMAKYHQNMELASNFYL